jgi:hypothetical protein
MRYLTVLVLLPLFSSCAHSTSPQEVPMLQAAYFETDATPPLGTQLCCNGNNPAREISATLSARGLLLVPAAQPPIVLCAVDWLGIANASHEAWRAELAAAAGTTPERVAVHVLHQHDAPEDDMSTEKRLENIGMGGGVSNLEFTVATRQRVATAIRDARQRLEPVTAIGTGQAVVEKIASNRRILGPDGKVIAVRWTATKDPTIRAEPEGTIDPLLKCLSLWHNDRPLAVLTYYATHPQSYYGKGQVNPDFPGLARASREAALPGVPHVHFNGAGGNIGAGKYNDGSPENRQVLADRLAEGMRRAWESTVQMPLTTPIEWRADTLLLPLREEIDTERERATLNDPAARPAQRMQAANELAFRERMEQGIGIPVARLRLGPADILHLPGELFVEYQLAAQKMRTDRFVCVAAYGDYGPGYIGTAEAYPQGGYETQLYTSRTSPAVEAVLLGAITNLLAD